MPGIVFNGHAIPGLVQKLRWGPWQRAAQYHSMFGLIGTTALDGGLQIREFVAPMLIYNSYVSWSVLQTALESLDDWIGDQGAYTEVNLSSQTVRTLALVELAMVITDNDIFTEDRGWQTEAQLVFRQLKPG